MTGHIMLLVVLSVGLIGTADFFGGIASKRSHPFTVAAWSQLAGIPLVLIAAVWVGSEVTAVDTALGAAAGLGSGFGVVVMYRGFSLASVGVVAPITSIVAAILPIVIGLMLGERPSTLVAAGLLVGLGSVVLIGVDPGRARVSVNGVLHGVVAGIAFGAMVIAYASTSDASGLTSALSGRATAAILAIGAVLVARAPRRVGRSSAVPTALAGVLAGVGMVFYVLASQGGDLIVVGLAIALFPAVTVVLAAVFLRERLKVSQWIGIGLAVLAVVMISVG